MKTNLPPHLNPLPQGGEETRFNVRPLPRGEGRGEGQIAKHLHTAAAFLVITLLLAAGNAACAQPFNNWPTYASDPLTNWPKASEYEKLVEDLTWCYGALKERSSAVGGSTNGIEPAVGTIRLPKSDVQRFKDRTATVIPAYGDESQADSFTNKASIPMLTVTGVLSSLSLTNDYFDSTPDRCLQDVAPAGCPSGRGVPALMSVIRKLKWTVHRRNSRYDNKAECLTRGGAGTDPGYSSAARHDATNHWNMTAWVTNWATPIPYYQAVVEQSCAPDDWDGTYYWLGSRCRAKATLVNIPVLPGVGFDWALYLEVEDSGADFRDIDGLGYECGKLFMHETGMAATSTTNLISDWITADPADLDTCPILVEPMMTVSNYPVRHGKKERCKVWSVDWVLKWDFQYDE